MDIIFTWRELIVRNGLNNISRYPASCNVRHELNGRRLLHNTADVVYTFPVGGHRKPYMPRQFPSGIYKITKVEWTEDPEYAPVKIRTTATRDVFIWDLDYRGGYDKPTEEIQSDSQYHIHFTDSPTTLGCIKCNKREDMVLLAKMIEPIVVAGEDVYLEVL